jgi:hypothetical protein
MLVARNMGHTDTHMVEKHYGYLAPGYVGRRHPLARAKVRHQAREEQR